jgi:quinol monooxygenase YgiN
MAYVLAVTWIAKPGNEAATHQILRKMGEASRQEPGVVTYTTHVDPENPREFFIYEKYHDIGGLEAHRIPPTSRSWCWGKRYRCSSLGCDGDMLIFNSARYSANTLNRRIYKKLVRFGCL